MTKNQVLLQLLPQCLLLVLLSISANGAIYDVNGDEQEGIAEAIHALQVASSTIPASGNCIDNSGNNGFFEQTRPLENLEDWNTNYTGTDATYSQTGTSSQVSITGNTSGSDDINFVKSFSQAQGVIGTINVSNINQAAVGFGMHIGKINGYHVHTNINFSEWNGELKIRYKLRLRDSDNNHVKDLIWGYVPANDKLNQDTKIGFVLIDNTVHFYIDGEQLFKWQPTDTITAREWFSVWYWEWVDNVTTSTVSATFKDISIIE